ncbi:MAG: hypothetical protein ABI408_04770 [Gemmatimonadaceae bacterium]
MNARGAESSSMESLPLVAPLIPRHEVFEEAGRRGLAPTDDRFDRFRKAKLLNDLAYLPDSKQRGFTPVQQQHFFNLLSVSQQITSKRPRPSALAFWLCWHGATDVPADLVAEHIERSVLTFLRTLKRQYERRRVPSRSNEGSERWRQAGLPWAKAVIKEFLTPYVKNAFLLDVVATGTGFALRSWFSNPTFESTLALLKRFVWLFGAKDINVDLARQLWDMLQDGLRLFTTGERSNPLLCAVREVNASNPQQIIELVHDARRAFEVMGTVFPIYRRACEPPTPVDPQYPAVAKYYLFPPGMAAVTALVRDVPHAVEMRRQLKEGNTAPMLEEFKAIGVIRDSVMFRLDAEPAK